MPDQWIPFIATVLAGFFAIMNPIVNTPIFVGSGEKIVRVLGTNAVSVIGRLMGLILATLGVHMLSLGIYGSVVEGMRFVAQQQ
jgi:small neutral amino acid transporter SnatA (MarC family)